MSRLNLFAFSTEEKLILNCLVVRTCVTDHVGLKITSLSPGTDYLHVIELVRNVATWPLDFTVVSSLKDGAQLNFGSGGNDWQFRTLLQADEGSDMQEGLICKKKFSGKDSIKTTFMCDSGHSEELKLPLRIS